MFRKILVANRGEIACRVIRTCRRLRIETVAVYSDADRDAMHVRIADEAVHIGPSPAAQSYLQIDRIVEACVKTGAQAVHPGYGFLSERTAFPTALEKAGVVFIGPAPRAIEAMGDKITSKVLAQKAGVSTVPGYTDVIRDAAHAVTVAREIGYPVMLKATAGGGGKGMRVVANDAECREGFQRATSEAQAAFGDGRVFAEKFIEDPRHIEIQVLADSHGNAIYLGERECSIQRRHQKVIEEAPSPFIDEKTRRAMGEQAVALARAVDYRSAGTVEFIVGPKRNFYFLEMNTRLQVEHPVTEMVTGLDLVELMIRVAAGEALPIRQSDVKLNGWAIEARVYAEDPFRNFMPSIGRLRAYRPPVESESVRVDTGIEEGSEVSVFYDPMIAKLVTHGATRDQAIEAMNEALDGYYIRGLSHNISFLNALIAHPRFREGRLSTNFIAEEYGEGFRASDVPQDDPAHAIVVAAAVHRRHMDRAAQLSGQLARTRRKVRDGWVVVTSGGSFPTRVLERGDGFEVVHAGRSYAVDIGWAFGCPLVDARVDGHNLRFQIDYLAPKYRLSRRGADVDLLVVTPRTAELTRHMLAKQAPDLSRFLLSPMPGLLKRVAVKPGDEVKAGEELAIVEAMKMENSLRAARDGRIGKLLAEQGQSLAVDQPILSFE
jgi:propionyl-CoA carboxylase alpha chain